MSDVFLRQGAATPSDVVLRTGLAAVTGTASCSQAEQSAVAAGALAFTGTISAQQLAQTVAATGTAASMSITGTAAAAQEAQEGSLSGSSGAEVATPEEFAGEWVRIDALAKELAVRDAARASSAPRTGAGGGQQAAQTGSAAAASRDRIRGFSSSAQIPAEGLVLGRVSTTRRDEQDLLEMVLLDMAA